MTYEFSTISSIKPALPSSWKDQIFLTFDIDWANDSVLSDTIDLVEEAGVKATWFITHDTPLISRLRANADFELGIHPNFNFLLEGDGRNGKNATEVVDRLLDIVPEAKSVRSHSATQSSRLFQLFKEKGLTHDCNCFIPEQASFSLKPWTIWNGLVQAPYFWADELRCINECNADPRDLLKRDGIKIFDFHPIHVFLNTERIARYEETREHHQSPERLLSHRYNGDGARSVLRVILETEQCA